MTDHRHRPHYHLTAPTNWINDPNGICFHGGRWHVHYQYNPNGAKWGDIHWGHASSADLVHWRDEPIALAPSPGPDAEGCFSGSYALVDGTPTLYYTGYTAERQVQCVATSRDLVHWTKHPERTIVEPPPGVEPQDFRDPYVFRDAVGWVMVVGASLDHERGQALLYRSDDGLQWQYRGPLFTADELRLGVMWECPNLFPVGDRWVLVVSHWLGLGVRAFVGDFRDDRFEPRAEQMLDVDAGAFAHLATQAPDGRTLQWAWINEQREQRLIDADGWAGALTVPRELGVDDRDRLTSKPVAELTALREAPADVQAAEPGPGSAAVPAVHHRFSGRHLDLDLRFDLVDREKVGLVLLASPDDVERTRIVFHPDARRLTVERASSSLEAGTRRQDVHAALELDRGEPLRLRVLLDASVLEVYANDRVVITTRVYPTRDDSVHGRTWSEGRSRPVLQAWTMGRAMPAVREPLRLPDPA